LHDALRFSRAFLMRLQAKTSGAGPARFADSRATRRARNFVDDLSIGQDVACWSRALEMTIGETASGGPTV